MKRFKRWLLTSKCSGRMLDLKADVAADPRFPSRGEKNVYRLYLERQQACKACLETFEDVWMLYLEYRRREISMSFIEDAISAGFTREQAEFLDECTARRPHTHSIDDIDGLEEALEDAGIEAEESEDEND